MHRIAFFPGIVLFILLLVFFFLGLASWRTPAALEKKESLFHQFRQNWSEAVKELERGRQ